MMQEIIFGAGNVGKIISTAFTKRFSFHQGSKRATQQPCLRYADLMTNRASGFSHFCIWCNTSTHMQRQKFNQRSKFVLLILYNGAGK